MSLVPFSQLMADAESGGYAVGYFEAWNLESLLAIADAAKAMRSPVMLGFSGIYLPNMEFDGCTSLRPYAALCTEICRNIPTSACMVFNESPYIEWVYEAIKLEFGLVMFSDPELTYKAQTEKVRLVTEKAHASSVAVEGELKALPGVAGKLSKIPANLHLTDPAQAQTFVEVTGVDSLAVNVGQVHVHGRNPIRLDLARLAGLRKAISVPMVLHGGTSIRHQDISKAIALGVRKINVGSVLKRTYFEALRRASQKVESNYNPYDVVGSGLRGDVLAAGRAALRRTVERLMVLYGSAGRP